MSTRARIAITQAAAAIERDDWPAFLAHWAQLPASTAFQPVALAMGRRP